MQVLHVTFYFFSHLTKLNYNVNGPLLAGKRPLDYPGIDALLNGQLTTRDGYTIILEHLSYNRVD